MKPSSDLWLGHNLRRMQTRPLLLSRVQFWRIALPLTLCMALAAQEAAPQPTVIFTFDFPGSDPDHYVITVAGDGRATYTSTGKLNAEAEATSFALDFTISTATRARIFDLARRAHYFAGELNSRKKGLASTGAKTLAYKDAQTTHQATYNYSADPAAQELTQLFQQLSMTLEFGHRLEYFHRYQKLALDEETKRMEQMAKSKDLSELQAVRPILLQIAEDSSVINVVRARAQRLLSLASSAPGSR